MRKSLALALLLLSANSVFAQRARYNFNPGWLVKVGDPAAAETPAFDDSAWKPVTLPYAWNEDYAFKVSIHDLPTGIAWYRKHFRVPANAAGQRVFLEFEGIRMAGTVYLNGKLIGRHEDGVAAFGFDITDSVKPAPEDNVLSVRTDNDWKYKEIATGTQYHWNDANFYANYGGINRNVWLHVTAPLHQTLPLYSSLGTTGTYIWASDFVLPTGPNAPASARITAETQVRNDSPTPQTAAYTVTIEDPHTHKTIATFTAPTATFAPGDTTILSASGTVSGLQLWSWGYGYLYDVVTSLSINGKPTDAVTTRTGFRKTEFTNGMVKLNGRIIQMHGYAQRTTNEWPALGIDLPPWLSDYSNQLMVRSNGNLVRWMHVTPSKQDTDSADRAGLIVSMPAGDSEGDSKGRQWAQRVELMRDSLIYNRNNPSILFYESGNKGVSDEHMAEMNAVRNTYDPHGGRAAGAREMLASTIAEYGGEMLYIDKSATKPLWAHEYNRDEGARAFRDDLTAPYHADSPLYNRNQDSFAIEDIVRWDDYFRARPGTGTRVSSGGVNIIFADSNTHYRGDNNYRRSGEVDAMRLPKDGFFAHLIMWNGWVDPEKPGIFILGHWNYDPGLVKPIYVVAAGAAHVELKLNGKSQGIIDASPTNPNQALAVPTGAPTTDANALTNGLAPGIPSGQSNDFLFTFPKVEYIPGILEAIAYDSANKPIASFELHTVGKPAALRLTPHLSPFGLHADGSDLAIIDVEAVDAKGQRVPIANPLVDFTLSGPAEWRGGIAQGSAVPAPANDAPNDNHGLSATPPTKFLHDDNYILSKSLPLEDGINRVTVRSSTSAGTITIRAEAPDLAPATLTLKSIEVLADHGLSMYDPTANLPEYLERGPTPLTGSVHPTRVPIVIASATAGSDPEKANLSFDDNETTAWVSDGTLAKAWVEYTFAKLSAPTQLELRLNAFRTRHYPIRVTLDGVTLFEGTTPSNLGYVTVPLQPAGAKAASGTHLRIALTAPPIDGIQAKGTAEVTGKFDGAGVAPVVRDGKAVLNVIEADIYQSVSAP